MLDTLIQSGMCKKDQEVLVSLHTHTWQHGSVTDPIKDRLGPVWKRT